MIIHWRFVLHLHCIAIPQPNTRIFRLEPNRLHLSTLHPMSSWPTCENQQIEACKPGESLTKTWIMNLVPKFLLPFPFPIKPILLFQIPCITQFKQQQIANLSAIFSPTIYEVDIDITQLEIFKNDKVFNSIYLRLRFWRCWRIWLFLNPQFLWFNRRIPNGKFVIIPDRSVSLGNLVN